MKEHTIKTPNLEAFISDELLKDLKASALGYNSPGIKKFSTVLLNVTENPPTANMTIAAAHTVGDLYIELFFNNADNYSSNADNYRSLVRIQSEGKLKAHFFYKDEDTDQVAEMVRSLGHFGEDNDKQIINRLAKSADHPFRL